MKRQPEMSRVIRGPPGWVVMSDKAFTLAIGWVDHGWFPTAMTAAPAASPAIPPAAESSSTTQWAGSTSSILAANT